MCQSRHRLMPYHRRKQAGETAARQKAGEEKQSSIPEGIRTPEELAEWVANNSNDIEEVLNAYNDARELAKNTLKPWQRELLGKKISTSSFARFGDRNQVTGTLAKSWLRKDGQEIDAIVHEFNEDLGANVTEQDIIDFILANPSGRVSEVSDTTRALSFKFSEIATKEMGFPIGGPESNTGKLYIKLKKANKEIAGLTNEQKAGMRDAMIADMNDPGTRHDDGYYASLSEYMELNGPEGARLPAEQLGHCPSIWN